MDYGESLDQMIAYADETNTPKVFPGNNNSHAVHRNDFPHPVVARFVRVNPRQWSGMIALRIELFGCDYATDIASFDGQSYIRIDLTFQPIISVVDRLHFRFKTIESEGLLIYSHGYQGDIFAVQLVRSSLILTIGLGGGKNTIVKLGSAVDDGVWHSVSIAREEYQLEAWLDGVPQVTEMEHGYFRINLERELFIGGMLNLQQPFVKATSTTQARQNFKVALRDCGSTNHIIWQLRHFTPPGSSVSGT
ncbi:putative Neurexin-4 [Hypsibius exemplaris]|uniref:Neurexin-4 n=1 Tax=Hypsibius exemplaris TaxID=2072580 RepID=A0A9X6RLG0_HYPEX|nr:putative Neurexin-4 [Hypsibius exemplaris]